MCENTFLKIYLPSAKIVNCRPSFWCVGARGKQNLEGDAFEYGKGNGDVRDCNIRTAAAVVLYDTSTRCSYSSLEPLVPGAAYLVYQAGSTCSRASPVPAARAALATGAWVESKHMYVIHTWK